MDHQVHMRPTTLLIFLLGLLQSDIGDAQRMVTIQTGPLYRIKGFPVSISCEVTGFKGPTEQHFQFSAYLASNPEREIQIVSSDPDDGFGYAVFSSRVRSKDIWIERLSGSSVIFHIKQALLQDTAKIECNTPNTDGTFLGTYSAFSHLHVVEDTLLATYSGSRTVSLTEGDDLQLECLASSQTFQHTHLSVTWFLRSSGQGEPHPILGLDRDLTVTPGQGYEARYQSKHVRIEKIEGTRYRLQMTQVQQGDQGQMFCRVEEWIQDPDREWVKIASRDTESTTVTVKAIEVSEDSFSSEISVASPDVQEGGTAEVQCSVQAKKLPELFFTVAWFRGDQELAQLGPLGRLSVAPAYKSREQEGELRAVKITEKDYRLTLRPARAEDQGLYQCRVWQEQRTADGAFTKVQSQHSSTLSVTVTAKESGLAVTMDKTVKVNEGSPLVLTCNVIRAQNELSIEWQYRKESQGSLFSDVIKLRQDGVTEVSPQYQQRVLRTSHSVDGAVVLEMGEVGPMDDGVYKCIVSEWTQDPSGKEKKTTTLSQECSVQVEPLDKLVNVALRSRTITPDVGSKMELLCIVKGPKVPISVAWLFQRAGSSSWQTLASSLHTGELVWGPETSGYQLSTIVSKIDTQHILSMANASTQNNGSYKCEVGVFLQQTQRASKPSNSLGVQVKKPTSKLRLTHSPTTALERTVNSDIELSCTVAQATFDSSRFNVTWKQNGRILSKSDQEGRITLQDARASVSTLPDWIFQLTLHQSGTPDSGNFLCEVQEWLRDPAGVWFPLATETATMKVTITETPSKFMMDQMSTTVNATEGDRIEMSCKISAGQDDPSAFFSLTWLFTGTGPEADSNTTTTLLTYTHKGAMTYGDNLDRIRFSCTERYHGTFILTIDKVELIDSGQYWCVVDQYWSDCKGTWKKMASKESGDTVVTVKPRAGNLRLKKDDGFLNVTDVEAGFRVDCVIDSTISIESLFEVTWFRSKGGQREDIFHVTKTGIQKKLGNTVSQLSFQRPSDKNFSLALSNCDSMDSGEYSCEMIQWATISNSWRNIKSDKSGVLRVHVHTGDIGSRADSVEATDPTVPVFVVLLLVLVVVVAILSWMLHKANAEKKKQQSSLWAEYNPLKPKPDA